MGKYLVSILFGGVFLGVGLLFALVISGNTREEATKIEGLPGQQYAEFVGLYPGAEVAVTGMLLNNPVLSDNPVAGYELVAYEIDEWNVTGDDNNTGNWTSKLRNIPLLSMQFEDLILPIHAEQNRPNLSGSLHTFIEEETYDNDWARYNGNRLYEGSLRIQGLRNSDLVTVVGDKADDGGIIPDRIHNGTHTDLVEYLREGVQIMQIVGGVFVVIGAVVLIGTAVYALK